ncbi:MAG: transglycosylase SLT domain-containing protein [Burkholderiales bacterium]
MKASNADSVSAGLGLIWLMVALGLVLLLAQRAAAPERQVPADGRIEVLGAVEAAPVDPVRQAAVQHEQRALAEYIARRWRIADSAAASFVAIAYRAGQQHSVDPVLILSVMAIESRYNPVAESDMGAKGLMQVIPRFHLEKLSDHGGEEALLDPEVNIHVGAQILREYYRRFGDQELALQMYAGAFDEPTSQYAGKVFAERARLEPVRQRARKPQTAQAV